MKKPIEHLSFDDLKISSSAMEQLIEVISSLRKSDNAPAKPAKGKKEGQNYRVLFYGASGTGKTMAASVVANQLNRQIKKIDLSSAVSKYIGETEKNVSTLFKDAADKKWILLFDEADALFGKRTEVKDAHDRYANIEVTNLLQQMEKHPGVVIVESKAKGNIDEAFLRRFHSVINFGS